MSEKCHENETLMKKNVVIVSKTNKSSNNKSFKKPASNSNKTTTSGLSRLNSETKSDDDSYEKEITFFKLFCFADKIDKLLLLVGTLASLFGGLVYPFMFFMYGDLAGTFVDFDKFKLSNSSTSTASSSFSGSSSLSSIDYANFLNRLSFLNNSNYTNKCIKTNKIDSDFDSRVSKSIKFYLTIGVVSLFVNYLANVCWNTACERQIKKMRNKLYERIMHHEIEFFDKNAPGELTSLITNNIDAIKMGIGFKLSDFLNMLCRSGACLCVALFSAWKFTLAFLILAPFIVASIVLMVIKMKQYSLAELRAYEGAGKIAYEMLSSIRVVLAYSLERKAINKYASNLNEAELVAKKKGLLTGIFMSISTALFNLFFAISLVYGTFLVQFDCRTYNVSKIIRALFCMVSCCFSTSQALPYFRDLAEAKVSARKIFSILESNKSDESPSGRFRGGGKTLDELNGEICFENVSFSYPQRKEHSVLNGLNLTIKAGKTTAIVGHSGSGKSTILSLIQRFYTPNSGRITIDGHAIDELDIDWLRSQMAFVSQEPVLFSNSISENIRLGRLEATESEIVEAAVKAHAHQFISLTNEKYSTQVGERGAHLSGGQKQRIAIARALIREPKIILLDEATSALDFESERVVQTALLRSNSNGNSDHNGNGVKSARKASNRAPTTTIIVAHRLSTIRQADEIVFLDESGRVKETGTHEDLMERRGHYYEMVQAQTKCKRERTIESANFVGEDDEEENDEDDDDEAASCEEEINVAMKLMYRASSRKSTIRRGKRSRGSLGVRQARRQKIPFKYERKLFGMQKNDLGWMLVGCVSEMLHGLVFPCVALVFSEIFNIFTLGDARAQLSLALSYMFVIMAIAAVDFVATLSYSYAFALCGARLTRRVRLSMFSSMLRQEIAYHDIGGNKSSLLAASLSTMAPLCKGLTSDKIGLLSQALTSVGFSIIIAFALNWKLAIAVTIFVPISFYTGVFVGRSNSNTHLKAKFSNDADDESGFSLAIESFENIRTIASLGRERHFADTFERIYDEKFPRTLARLHLHALFYSISSCLLFFIQAFTFTFGYYLIKQDSLHVADLFRIYTTVTFSSMILGRVYAQLPDQRKSLEAAKWAFKIIERRSKIDSMSESGLRPCNEYLTSSLGNSRQSSAMLTALNTSIGSIQFENVTFSYPNRPSVKVLRGLNLTIKPGLVNAIVGVSGCGKSTILALLLRFYDVDSGTIYLDNIDIRKLNIRWLRSKMGLVLQEPALFNMSIFENIAYGDVEREDIDLNKVIDVAVKSNIHYKIDSLPEKYDTIVGNKGSLLSGGEKQRIAIARALIRQPGVLLLDEATSALDNASEQVVQDALEKAQHGRTSIVIAHRLSTIQNANKISVIKDGALVEEGTHDELMQNEGSFYFNLYSHSI